VVKIQKQKVRILKVLITGANGFIGKNLFVHLQEKKEIEILTLLKNDSDESLIEKVSKADFIFHLAGINRPLTEEEFIVGNIDLTSKIVSAVRSSKRQIPILFTSSTQASLDNAYGKSKSLAEKVLNDFYLESKNPIYIYRLPNVFGKWCRPNYNSVVATFCYNILNDQPIKVNDPASIVNLVYIDDVIEAFLNVLLQSSFKEVTPVYKVTVGEIRDLLLSFKTGRLNLMVDEVGSGFTRALYATYLSYYEFLNFKYPLKLNTDPRGSFVEILKTKDSGQVSFFTAHAGITRGVHYHHTKNEKFLVVKGEARFSFRHMITNEKHEIFVKGEVPEIVETIPGWTHDITNIGNDEMLVVIWANEIFDRNKPDTYASRI
jgi:UDP-2-acetamido-2,6-beta-L-arabino-hexul-4-ose reductase